MMYTPLTTLKGVNNHYRIALENIGVDSVEALTNLIYNDLKKVKGLGTIGRIELNRALNEMGLKLKEG